MGAGTMLSADAERIIWLQSASFAGSPTEAQGVLVQMANFISNGRSVAVMNTHAQRKLAEYERCEAELSALQARQGAH